MVAGSTSRFTVRQRSVRAGVKSISIRQAALDIACGSSGRFIGTLLKHGFQPKGMNISREMVHSAKPLHPDITFYVDDIFSMPYCRRTLRVDQTEQERGGERAERHGRPRRSETSSPPALLRVVSHTAKSLRRSVTLQKEHLMNSERQKMRTGELYDPLDLELVAARERARDLCQSLHATREAQHEERERILHELFGMGGDTVLMQPPFFCDYGSNIELGKRVSST
jgi:maltose acetyltransferase-like protein